MKQQLFPHFGPCSQHSGKESNVLAREEAESSLRVDFRICLLLPPAIFLRKQNVKKCDSHSGVPLPLALLQKMSLKSVHFRSVPDRY